VSRTGRSLFIALGAVTALVAGPACSSSDSPAAQGSAFPSEKPLTARIAVAPGDAWSYMIAGAKNSSAGPVDLQHVELFPATGSGRVSVGTAQVAPLPADPDEQPHGWTPSGIFKTDPPTFLIPGGNCNIQQVAAVHGYQLQPGDEVRFLFVMRSQDAGTTTFPSFRVTYTQAGQTLEQSFATSLVVTSRSGHPIAMGFAEKPCAHLTQVLASGT
jgi:hypothetical protein